MTDATVYAVASGKGGVGKTTTAVNLGASFANAGRSTVVVDLDLGMANLADFLDATPAGPNLHDVLAGDATLDDAISHAGSNLDVIFGSEALADFAKADPTRIRNHLVTLRERYDVIVLDSGGGLSHDTALPLGLADEVLLVSTVETPAIANAKKTIDLVERLDGRLEGLVLTRIGGGEASDPTTIADSLGLRLVGAVPEDSTVKRSASAGEPLHAFDPDCPAAQAYREMAYDLLDEPLPMNVGGGTGSSGSAGSNQDVMDAVASTAIAAEEAAEPAADESTDPVADETSDSTDEPSADSADEPPADSADELPADAAAGKTVDATAGETADVAAEAESAPEAATGETDGPRESVSEAIETASTGTEGHDAAAGEETEEETGDVDEGAGEEQPVAVEQGETEAETTAESRSLLSRLTGGLIG